MTVLTRRRFLGATAGVAVGAVCAGAFWLETSRTHRSHHTAIVIGSGYGGGASALRLGQAGIDTLLLEKGSWWNSPDQDGKRFSKMLATVAIVGGLAINTAHEWGHKRETAERWLSKIALAQTCYGHFFVEHNRGHHVRSPPPRIPRAHGWVKVCTASFRGR